MSESELIIRSTWPGSGQSTGGHGLGPSRALPLVISMVAIISLGPYFAWAAPLYFRASVVLLVVVFLLATGAPEIRFSRRNVGLSAACILLMTYYAAHRRGGIYDPSTGWLAVVLFILLPERLKSSTFRCFSWVFALSLLPAITVWMLSAAGVDVPWSYLYAKRLDADYLIGNGGSYYRQYLGSVLRSDGLWVFPSGSTIFRLHGLYEEPGLVGTVAGLLLVASRFRLKARPENIILLAAGLMSFSLAFFAISYAYLVWRSPAITIALTAIVIMLVIMLDVPAKVPLLRLVFFDRLAISDGGIAGDNRVTPIFSALYHEFWRSDLFTRLFGSERDISAVVDTGAFSFKAVIYQYGVAGFVGLLTVLSAALLSMSRRRDSLMLLGVLLLSIYQRPNVLSLPFVIILLGGAASIERSGDAQGFTPPADDFAPVGG